MSKALLMVHAFSCVFAAVPQAAGAVLYVDKQNPAAQDSNPGTQSLPFKTIQKAASTAAAGDSVVVKAGVYNEFVTLSRSGANGSPITFSGERGSNGQWLTIIDPSTPATNGWISAPEIGFGVYKKANLPFSVRELTIDHKRVAFVNTMGNLASAISQAYYTNWSTGAELLALPKDVLVKTRFNGKTINFWDGIEALYCSSGNVCYLRLRNGGNPNGMNIRIAPNNDAVVTTDMLFPAVKVQNANHIVWRNFSLRGAFGGVYVSGGHDNLIESNRLSGGYARLLLVNGAYQNTVRNNEVTANYYGCDSPGAWERGTENLYLARENAYLTAKFLMGDAASFDYGVGLINAGNSNSVCANKISKVLGTGLWIVGNPRSPTRGTALYDNGIEGASSVGILMSEGHTHTKIHGNRVSDCNINLRFHHMNTAGETNRTVYIYRNRLWLPSGVGTHTYFHTFTAAGGYLPEFWVYHNSFSGGFGALQVSSDIFGVRGLTNSTFINNIFSGTKYYDTWDSRWTNASFMGVFDFNITTPPWPNYPTTALPAWFGANNIRLSAAEWTNTWGMNFALKAGSSAIDAAINVSQPFTLRGKTHPALPDSRKRHSSAWDIGAMEYFSPPTGLRIIGSVGY